MMALVIVRTHTTVLHEGKLDPAGGLPAALTRCVTIRGTATDTFSAGPAPDL